MMPPSDYGLHAQTVEHLSGMIEQMRRARDDREAARGAGDRERQARAERLYNHLSQRAVPDAASNAAVQTGNQEAVDRLLADLGVRLDWSPRPDAQMTEEEVRRVVNEEGPSSPRWPSRTRIARLVR